MLNCRYLVSTKWDILRVEQIRIMVLINEAYRVALNLVCFVDGLNIHLLIGLKLHVSETYPASSRISVRLIRNRKYISDWMGFSFSRCSVCQPFELVNIQARILVLNCHASGIGREMPRIHALRGKFRLMHWKMLHAWPLETARMADSFIPIFAWQCGTSGSGPRRPVIHHTGQAW